MPQGEVRDLAVIIDQPLEKRGNPPVPVCTVDQALRMVAAFNDLLRENVHILSSDWVPLDGEEHLFEHAHQVAQGAVLAARGITALEDVRGWPQEERTELCDELNRLIYARPEIIALVIENQPRCEGDLLALCDMDDPYNALYMRTALADARIDVGSVFMSMSDFTQLSDFVPDDDPGRAVLRRQFRSVVDFLHRQLGLGPIGSMIRVMDMRGGAEASDENAVGSLPVAPSPKRLPS